MVDFIRKVNPDGSVTQIALNKAITGAIPLDDPEAIKKECMESLLLMLAANKGDIKALAVVRELLDRVEGKAVQRIDQRVSHSSNISVSGLSTSQILERLAALSPDALEGAGVKLIEGQVVRVES